MSQYLKPVTELGSGFTLQSCEVCAVSEEYFHKPLQHAVPARLESTQSLTVLENKRLKMKRLRVPH